jgi:hypothetical protein
MGCVFLLMLLQFLKRNPIFNIYLFFVGHSGIYWLFERNWSFLYFAIFPTIPKLTDIAYYIIRASFSNSTLLP